MNIALPVMSKEQLIAIIGALFSIGGGAIYLFWPEKIRDYGLKAFAESKSRFDEIRREAMLAEDYIWPFRVVGFFSIVIGIILIWLLLSGEIK